MVLFFLFYMHSKHFSNSLFSCKNFSVIISILMFVFSPFGSCRFLPGSLVWPLPHNLSVCFLHKCLNMLALNQTKPQHAWPYFPHAQKTQNNSRKYPTNRLRKWCFISQCPICRPSKGLDLIKGGCLLLWVPPGGENENYISASPLIRLPLDSACFEGNKRAFPGSLSGIPAECPAYPRFSTPRSRISLSHRR